MGKPDLMLHTLWNFFKEAIGWHRISRSVGLSGLQFAILSARQPATEFFQKQVKLVDMGLESGVRSL